MMRALTAKARNTMPPIIVTEIKKRNIVKRSNKI